MNSERKELTRRDFLRWGAAALAGGSLAGCHLFKREPVPTVTPEVTDGKTIGVAASDDVKESKTATPTATSTATPKPTAKATIDKKTVVPAGEGVVPGEKSLGDWELTFYPGATEQMKVWGESILHLPIVTDWSKFPNVDFSDYDFKAEEGVEYGMAESGFCQQDERCDINVPAKHYRLISGDYAIPGIDECEFAKDNAGCAIALFNVGETTAMFRDAHVDYGFTVFGQYKEKEVMPKKIRALLSHTAFKMLNIEGGVNEGANCSSPDGCSRVRLAFAIISGNQLLMKGVTSVGR